MAIVKARHAATGVLRGAASAALGVMVILASGASGAGIRMRVRYGFEGLARAERWSPVTVELDNDGPERQGLLVLAPLDRAYVSQYERRGCLVRLPQGSHQRYSLVWRDPVGMGVTPGAVFAREAAPGPAVRYLDESESLVVAVGFPPGALGYLSRVERVRLSPTSAVRPGASGSGPAKGPIIVAHVRPGDLPESPPVYLQVDLLVLGPAFASDLSPGARAAITSWVQTGGNLAIVGGADAARLADPFFQALLPVEGLSASAAAIPSGLRGYGLSVKQPAAVVIGVPKPGAEVVAAEAGAPLIVRRRVGNGTVTFFAFDPTEPPVSAASGIEKLWVSLFNDRERVYSLQEVIGQAEGALSDRVTSIKQMKAPSLQMVVGFLGLYFLLLIPLNHWILSRWKRRELAWLTTPLIVALFFVGAYGVGYTVKGPHLLVKQSTIMEAGEGSHQALALTNFGVFSPARRSYDIHVGLVDAVVAEVSENPWGNPYGRGGRLEVQPGAGVIHDEREPWVERAQVPMWGMRVYAAHGIVDLGGAVRSSLRAQGMGVVGWIENGTKWTLREPTLMMPGTDRGVVLDDIAPGGRLVLDTAGRGTRGIRWQQDPASALLVRSLIPPQRLASDVGLLCRIPSSPVPVELGRPCEQSQETLLLVRLPLETGSARVHVPAGVYQSSSDAPSGYYPVLAEDPDIVYTFTPPADLQDLRVDRVGVVYELWQAGAAPWCEVLMFDPAAGKWRGVGSVPPADGRRSGSLNVPQARRFVGPEGVIKVKLVRRSGVERVQLRRVEIAVEGER